MYHRIDMYIQLLCVCLPECPWETKMKEKTILAKGNVMDGHVTEQTIWPLSEKNKFHYGFSYIMLTYLSKLCIFRIYVINL